MTICIFWSGFDAVSTKIRKKCNDITKMTDIDIDIDPLLAEEVPSDSDNSGSVQSETETIAMPPRTRPVLLRLAAACISAVLASGVLSAYPVRIMLR